MIHTDRLDMLCTLSEQAPCNCWGASLYVLGVNHAMLWVSPPEMIEFLMNKTVVVNDNAAVDDLIEGDVLSLWTSYKSPTIADKLIHSAVYLGDDNWYHKIGNSSSEVGLLSSVLDHYRYTERFQIHRVVSQ